MAVAVLAAELAVDVVRPVIVEHTLGVDTVALVAMVGALALSEELPGAVIGLMFSGGASLEAIASRARRELTRDDTSKRRSPTSSIWLLRGTRTSGLA